MCACVCMCALVCMCAYMCVSYPESSQRVFSPSLHINLGLSSGRCPHAPSPSARLYVSLKFSSGFWPSPQQGPVLMVMACDSGCAKTLKRALCAEDLGVLWGDAPRRTGLGGAVG